MSRAFHCQGRGACRPEDVRIPETYVVDQQGRLKGYVNAQNLAEYFWIRSAQTKSTA